MSHNVPYLPTPKFSWKFCISIVSNFSWDDCNSQEKWKTKFMQNFGRANKVHYGRCASGVSFHHQQHIQIVYMYDLDTWSVKGIRGCWRWSQVILLRCKTTTYTTSFFISLKFENPWLFCHLWPKDDKSTSYLCTELGKKHYLQGICQVF